MNNHALLRLLLLASLLLNVYWFYRFASEPLSQQSGQRAEPQYLKAQPMHQAQTAGASESTQGAGSYSPLTEDKPALASAAQESSSELSAESRSTLLAEAENLLKQERFTELRLLLRDYLQQQPLDMNFLLLEAQLIVKTELLSDAIAHYYSLTKLPMTAVESRQIQDSIEQLSSDTISQLQRAYSWDTLAIFVEPLLQFEPQNRLYILALAEAYAQQNQFNLMENILASIDFDDPAAQRIRQLAYHSDKEHSEQNQMPTANGLLANNQLRTAVALHKAGEHYIVNGLLSSNKIALLIDTGASITAISRDYFNTLPNQHKSHFIGRFSVNTAAGKLLAPMYQFSELRLNHAQVNNISVIVLPARSLENVDGLLGMNFLREFDFKIDQRQSELLLQR